MKLLGRLARRPVLGLFLFVALTVNSSIVRAGEEIPPSPDPIPPHCIELVLEELLIQAIDLGAGLY